MKKLLFLPFLLVCAIAFGQEPTTTDDAPVLMIIERVGNSMDFNVQSPDGTDLFYLASHEFCNPAVVSGSNPMGRDSYYEVIFYHDKQRCEVNTIVPTTAGITRWVVGNKLLENGSVNQAAEDKLVLVNAKRYSGHAGTTVIVYDSDN